MGGLYVNEISFVQLIGIGLYWRVIGVCIGVVFSCVFGCKWMREFFLLYSEQYDNFKPCSRGNFWHVKSVGRDFLFVFKLRQILDSILYTVFR